LSRLKDESSVQILGRDFYVLIVKEFVTVLIIGPEQEGSYNSLRTYFPVSIFSRHVKSLQSLVKDSIRTETPSFLRTKRLCLVIPTYNEKENIGKILRRLDSIKDSLRFGLDVLVVDDNSSDGTADIVREMMRELPYVKMLNRPGLLGIGSAYLDGFGLGLSELNSDYFGEMDADLQHPPEVLVEMCKTAISENADVVIASRYVEGGGSKGWSLGRRIVSKGANILARLCIKVPVSDATSGFRVLSVRAIRALLESKISTKGYAFQIESLYVYKKIGMTFAEVPYVFEERKAGETKLRLKEMVRFASVALRLGIFGMNVGPTSKKK
jgi:dolichol-phosphate mannosyltransferase